MVMMIDGSSVDRLLPYDECIDLMRTALASLARDEVFLPLRTVVRPPVDGVMALMPSYVDGAAPALGVKIVTIFHGNPEVGKDAHQGVVLLLDPATGEPQAVLDASAITRIRTAAASAVATDVLAQSGADDLAVIGSGTQARAHLRALARVRPPRRVRVHSRRPERGARFAAEMADVVDVPIEVASDVASCVAGASVIVTATNSAEPVLARQMVTDGAHVNAVGSSIPTTRELDGALMGAARVYTDRLESLVNESGDFLMAARDGELDADDVVGEIGGVLTSNVPGRGGPEEITVFKSLGLAVEDVLAARHVFRRWSAETAPGGARR
ncbi:MAG: ornithine cyclodeaminase family protein [Pseudonocardia sp.]|nr:ornithine cyclodeaminase family protein [Pseudonocardia sp.]